MCSGSDPAGAAPGVSGRFSWSKKRISCGAPFSVTVKSLAVKPSIGLPFLSVTTTDSTTNCVLVVNVGVALLPGCAFWPICCACRATAASRQQDRPAESRPAANIGCPTKIDCHQFRMGQNLNRSVVCILRMALALVGNPNWVLFQIVFQAVNATWFSALVE